MAAADDTTPPPTKKTSWKGSREKRQLRKDILEGLVDEEMTAEEVYDMRGGIYHKFVFKNFKNNLRNLRNFLKREEERAFFDSLAFYNDKRSKRPPATQTKKHWNGSRAQKWLVKDVDDELHLWLTPFELYLTREAYMEFEYDDFRKHIHQTKKDKINKHNWLKKKRAEEGDLL